MARQNRSSQLKREREQKKREHQRRKAEKAALKRERRFNKSGTEELALPDGLPEISDIGADATTEPEKL